MDYLTGFDISASGMSVEKTRIDVSAANIANINTPLTRNSAYQAKTVVSGPIENAKVFGDILDTFSGVEVKQIINKQLEIRKKYDPEHPSADSDGFVSYPGINTMEEMMTLISSVRAFEANVQALNASRAMAQSALEIGGKK